MEEQRFEYVAVAPVAAKLGIPTEEELTDRLNAVAARGWRLAFVYNDGHGYSTRLIFERPVQR